MASEKQINANRRNGKKGGPKTPAGRAAVRHNALKHGLSAQHPVIPVLEDQSAFDQFLNGLRQDLQPAGIMENLLVDQIADAHWRRQRIIQMEIGLFDVNKTLLKSSIDEKFNAMTSEGLLHLLAEADAKRVDMLGRYYRYDARFERSFFKAWKELKSLQAARRSALQLEAEVAEIEEPEAPPTEFAKQTQIKPVPPAPTHKSTSEPPAPTEKNGENDPCTL